MSNFAINPNSKEWSKVYILPDPYPVY
jgi:hypothetical protein